MKIKKSISIFTFSLFLLNIHAESFRIRKAHVISLKNELTEVSAGECNIYDAVAVYLPEDKTFIEGIEIKMVIPESIASWKNSVAATVYDKITPEPKSNQIDYSGTRLFVSTIPGKLSWVLQVPLKKENSIKENNYSTKIDNIPSSQATNLFVKFQPVMKGIPEEVLNSNITVSARPIFSDKGRLELNLIGEETSSENFSVFIDDSPVNLKKDIILKTGMHNLSVISENYRNEMRTFVIDQAKTTKLDIVLRGVEPSLILEAPEGVSIWLDDIECTKQRGKEFIITEGEHSLKFVIGSYEVVRNISAIKGKTYKASLDVDLSISEN